MKVTYLLGAGASAGSLPVVNDLSLKIDAVIVTLQGYKIALNSFSYDNISWEEQSIRNEHLDDALSDLQFLKIGCENHKSVDTFAKMLFLTSHKEDRKKNYRRVKCAVILFFELFRAYNKGFDKRYDAFIATVMNNTDPKLPNDLNIVSWNYDYEFEKAYLKYTPDTLDIHDIYKEINVTHKYGKLNTYSNNNFGILKINGTTGFYDTNGTLTLGIGIQNLTLIDNVKTDQSVLDQIFAQYQLLKKTHEPAISFSWEEDESSTNIKYQTLMAIQESELLIVIGYSFPYFNRKIDQMILRNFTNRNKRVVIQDLSEKIHDRLETVSNILSMPVTHIKGIADTDQFYMEF